MSDSPKQTPPGPADDGEGRLLAGGHPAIDRAYIRRYGRLLIALLIAFAIEGISEPGRWQLLILTVLLSGTLLLSMEAAEVRPTVLRAAIAVAAVGIALGIVNAFVGGFDERIAQAANAVLVLCAPPVIMTGIVRRLRETQAVPLDAVIGVLCVYLLLGMFFAFVFGAIDRLDGTQFFAQNVDATVANCTYYSFTTLATIGYGDLTSASNLGHTLSVSEGLVGQIYLVTVVSLIVGNLGRRRTRPQGSPAP